MQRSFNVHMALSLFCLGAVVCGLCGCGQPAQDTSAQAVQPVGGGMNAGIVFDQIDANQDGSLSRDEFMAAYERTGALRRPMLGAGPPPPAGNGPLNQGAPGETWGQRPRGNMMGQGGQGGQFAPPRGAPMRQQGQGPSGTGQRQFRGRPQPGVSLADLDVNGDGVVTSTEVPERYQRVFQQIDANGDGQITEQELAAGAEAPQGGQYRQGMGGSGQGRGPGSAVRDIQPEVFFQRFDKNQDGKLVSSEVPGPFQEYFHQSDADNNGVVTKEELAQANLGSGTSGQRGPGYRRSRR